MAELEPKGAEKTQLLQEQVDEVKGIMQANIISAAKRGEGLESLQTQTDELVTKASIFKTKAKEARWQMWVKDKKVLAALICVSLIVIAAILAPIINLLKK